MKSKMISLLFLALVSVHSTELPAKTKNSFLPEGRYYIARENINGPEFASFDYFEIRLRTRRSGTSYTGRLFARTDSGYAILRLRRIKTRSGRFRFETDVVNGTQFSFDGRLISRLRSRRAIACEPILRGKLRQIHEREGSLENELIFKYSPLTKEGACN
jgi:hypothetical protein